MMNSRQLTWCLARALQHSGAMPLQAQHGRQIRLSAHKFELSPCRRGPEGAGRAPPCSPGTAVLADRAGSEVVLPLASTATSAAMLNPVATHPSRPIAPSAMTRAPTAAPYDAATMYKCQAVRSTGD